ncbi:MAG: YbaB/EbfC family nucleoid-associated protein [Ignavibacteriales bacterium]
MEEDTYQQMFDRIREMRSGLEQAKARLRKKTIRVESGPVRLEMNGYQEVTGVWFQRGAAAQPALEDAVKAAVNEAVSRSRNMVIEEMGRLMGGVFPPGFGSLFD